MNNVLSMAMASLFIGVASSQGALVLLDNNMEGSNNWAAFDGSPGTFVPDPADAGNQALAISYTGHVNQSDSYSTPFPRPPVRPERCFNGCPPKANS